LLAIPPEQEVRFDRFSDSAGTYITLDSSNPAVYKQLYRAAKAKLKLRLRATLERKPVKEQVAANTAMDLTKPAVSQTESRNTFLETVLSQPVGNGARPSFKPFQKSCQFSPKCAIPGAFDLEVSNTEQPAKAASLYSSKDVYSLPTLPQMSDFPTTSYTIDCNHCGSSVPNEHYHCGICEGGDFDLCKACIDAGITCDGDEHWLLKRTILNGMVIPSTTETLPPKKLSKAPTAELITPVSPEHDGDDLTCNSCICRMAPKRQSCALAHCETEMPAREFFTCQECPDYDLCSSCFRDNDHGHDPSHSFEAQEPDAVKDDVAIKALCAPGRGVRHEAICDGCNEVSFPTTRLNDLPD
jgi:next-to-BRCA1 protein 1